jgi:hypothetical protein
MTAGLDLQVALGDVGLDFAFVVLEEAADGWAVLLLVEAVVETNALEGLQTLLHSLRGGFIENGPHALLVLVFVFNFLDLADEHLL